MVDRARVLEKIDEIGRYLKDLETVLPQDFQTYTSDLKTRYACERVTQVVIEALSDIAELFVIGERLGLPTEETGLSRRLAEGRILAEDQADLLRRMQGFRNVLAHRYGALDDEKVFQNLGHVAEDARRLTKAFKSALDARK